LTIVGFEHKNRLILLNPQKVIRKEVAIT